MRDEIDKIQLDVLKDSELFMHVKDTKREFEDSLAELTVSVSSDMSSDDATQKIFLSTYNRYTDFFNEINDFCIMVNIGAIKAEEYIKNTISVNISKYAKLQYETFDTLQKIAENKGYKKLSKPDYKAFEDYDKFLMKFNGENSAFWTELKTKRKEVGLE